MKVIIAGGRDFSPLPVHAIWLKERLLSLKCTKVISGKCKGADSFGEIAAIFMGIPIKPFPANWRMYGKSAGPIRNSEMAEYADAVILFPGGAGTANMKREAVAQSLIIIEYKGQ